MGIFFNNMALCIFWEYSNWSAFFLAHPSDPTQAVWAFPRAIFCCGPVPKWSPNCKFEILTLPLATSVLIWIFRHTLFSEPILQKRIVCYSHSHWFNLQENSSKKSRNLGGIKWKINRSTKLTVHEFSWYHLLDLWYW